MSSVVSTKFQVWKTVEIGTEIRDGNGFLAAIESEKMCFCGYDWTRYTRNFEYEWIRSMLADPRFVVATEKQKLDLALVSVDTFGFDEPVRRIRHIYERASEFGFELCPAEVGPQLRLQYKNQPNREHLWIAMEPISVPGISSLLFTVGRCNPRVYLSCSNGYDRPIGGGTQWYPDSLFVFVLPRK